MCGSYWRGVAPNLRAPSFGAQWAIYYTITPLNSVEYSSFHPGKKNNCFNVCCPSPSEKYSVHYLYMLFISVEILELLTFSLKKQSKFSKSLLKIFRKIHRRFACAKSSFTHIDGHVKNRILFKKEGTSCKQYVFKAKSAAWTYFSKNTKY